MKKATKHLTILLVTTLLSVVSACNTEETSTHDVRISWNISGNNICRALLPEDLGGGELAFDEIRISVFEDETSKDPLLEKFELCDEYETIIEDLPKGTYFIKLGAMAVYEEERRPYYQARGEIEAGYSEDEVFDFTLELGTGTVNVLWGFVDGGQCGEYGVVTVTVKLASTIFRGQDYAAEDLPCNPKPGKPAGHAAEVKWDAYSLTVEGFDSKGVLTYRGRAGQTLQVYPGDEIDAGRILLEKI